MYSGYYNGFGYQQPQPQPQRYVMQNGSFYLPPVNALPAPSYVQQTYTPTYQQPMQMAAPVYMNQTFTPMYQTQMQMPTQTYMQQQTYNPTYNSPMNRPTTNQMLYNQPRTNYNPGPNAQPTYRQPVTYNNPFEQQMYTYQRPQTNYNPGPSTQPTYRQTQATRPAPTLNKFSPIPPITPRQNQSFNRPLSSSGSSANYQSTSDWEKTGRVKRTKHLDGPITSDAVHSLLSELPWLTTYDRRMINQARCEVSNEWNVFLRNATVLIKLEDQDIELISGSGKNKLVVQKTDDGDMDCDWQDKGIGMKLRNGVRSVGRFFTSIFSKAKHAIGSFARKAIGW